MIIVQLTGGTGNQMFQYALGRVLSLKHGVSLGLDVEAFNQTFPDNAPRQYTLDMFNCKAALVGHGDVPFPYRSQGFYLDKAARFLFRRLLGVPGSEKKIYQFDPGVFALGDGAYLQGYWQSVKYFEGYENVIREDFQLKRPVSEKTAILADEIAVSQSVCIHVRRGDYVGNSVHDIVPFSYYARAFSMLSEKAKIDRAYVFSDDIEWCKSNLSIGVPMVFVGREYSGSKNEEHMYLMSKCKHFIIPNSTFSWWAAWLAGNPGKVVVAPKLWYADDTVDTSTLTPSSWVRI